MEVRLAYDSILIDHSYGSIPSRWTRIIGRKPAMMD